MKPAREVTGKPIQLDHCEPQSADRSLSGGSEKPFWQMIVDLGEEIPMSEWERVPTDISINHDHYLYGAPKVEEFAE